MSRSVLLLVLGLILGLIFAPPVWAQSSDAKDRAQSPRTLVVGSKNFTESAVLGEMMAQLIESQGEFVVDRKLSLGGTLVCFSALQNGELDLYADYTGTAWSIMLKEEGKVQEPLQAFLHVQREFQRRHDIEWLMPFGLNNTYAIVMPEAKAESMGIRSVSDLGGVAKDLVAGLSLEFMNREDGWPGLSTAYDLPFKEARGMEHGLAYAAIASGSIDVMDAYSTDGKLPRYKLRVLDDDRRFFPPYNAAPLVRGDALRDHPELRDLLNRLAFRLPDQRMQALNYRVEEKGESFAAVARDFLLEEGLLEEGAGSETLEVRGKGFWALMNSRWDQTWRLGLEHVLLTAISVALACLVSIPLAILLLHRPALANFSLGVAGLIQTIPSLALLAFMIPLLGLDVKAAIAALFLYAILPILRNTYTGMRGVDESMLEAAKGLGMRRRDILFRVEFPLAARTIMAGIRTSTVLSIGVATLAAFIGAGGYGEPIVTGLYLNDTHLILAGAIPAAILAVLADWILGKVEEWVSPPARSGA